MTFQRPSNSIRPLPTRMPTRLPTGFQVLPTAFQPCASNPPYPPGVGSASRRLGDGSRFPRLEGGRGEDLISRCNEVTARYFTDADGYVHAPSREPNGLTWLRFGPAARPRCFQDLADIVARSRKCLIVQTVFHRLPILLDHVEGVFARVSNQVFHSVGSVEGRRNRRSAKRFVMETWQKDRSGGGGGGKSSAAPIIDISILFRGGSKKSHPPLPHLAALEDE